MRQSPVMRALPILLLLCGLMVPALPARAAPFVDSVTPTYVDLANRVQQQTGIPYVLIDGRFDNSARAIRLLGQAIGATERAELIARDIEQTLAQAAQVIAGVAENKRPRVYLARTADGLETPVLPFGWIDRQPSLNRLIGLKWLLHLFHPERVEGDLKSEVRDFYRLYYHVDLDDAALAKLMGTQPR